MCSLLQRMSKPRPGREGLKSKLKDEDLNEVLDNLLQQAMIICGTKAGTLQLINKKNNKY